MSCALVLGSAKNKAYAADRKIGIFTHQKGTSLQDGVYFNAYGITPGKLGSELMQESLEHLTDTYGHVVQIPGEKVMEIAGEFPEFSVITNKNTYKTSRIVVAVGYTNTFNIEGLMEYVEPHKKSVPEKNRIQLKNIDHKVIEGIYVAGTLAGSRSQLSIAAGSGAEVATDILTEWNNGIQSQSHDSIRK